MSYAFVDPFGVETTAEMAIIYKSHILSDLHVIAKKDIPAVQNILRNMHKAGILENDIALDRAVHDLAFGKMLYLKWYNDHQQFTDGEKEFVEAYRIKKLLKQNTKRYKNAKKRGASLEELLEIDAEAVRLEMELQDMMEKNADETEDDNDVSA